MKNTILILSLIVSSTIYSQCWQSISSESSAHSGAITTDGKLILWGANNYGQLGDGTDFNTDINPWNLISTDGNTTAAIKTNGTLWTWGQNNFGQLGNGNNSNSNIPVQIGGAEWKSISMGWDHVLAIKTDGSLWTWGHNDVGQLGDNTNIDRNIPIHIVSTKIWQSVSAGERYSVALATDGTLWTWGINNHGQLGDNTLNDKNTPVNISHGFVWNSISAGSSHSLAITNGNLFTWGANTMTTGSGGFLDLATPTLIDSGSWQTISAGQYTNLAIKTDGSLWSWGDNSWGQLGIGNYIRQENPIQIGNETDWLIVNAGANNGKAMKTNHNLYAMGLNSQGLFGTTSIPNNGVSTVPVQVTCPPLSITGNEINSRINIYPNPCNDIIHINLYNETILNIIIYDTNGKIFSLMSKSLDVDTSQLQSGIYFLKILTDKSFFIKKIMKN